MFKKNRYFLFLIACFSIGAYQAIIVKPVADLLGGSQKEFTTSLLYQHLPYAALHGMQACPRLYQGLYHELVEVLEEQDTEVKLAYYGCYYLKGDEKCSEFWTLKKNIVPLANIHEQDKLPDMIDWRTPKNNQKRTAILKQPFRDAKTNTTYSAGTRFVIQTHDDAQYTVYVFNTKTRDWDIIHIPLNVCVVHTDNKREDFLTLVRFYAHLKNGFIPYVWGGGSFCYTLQKPFYKKTKLQRIFYPEKRSVKCGFDCSSLILRAAQMAGIAYFCRNTATLHKDLNEIKELTELHNGDLIFFPTHVIIVSDIDKNLCIEARGYKDGFGKIQELPLNKLFQGINTYKDLFDHYKKKMPLKRLDAQGKHCLTISNFKLLKLPV